METISVSKLKAHLSAELKRVERGIELTVVDHKRPVARLAPLNRDSLFVREAQGSYEYKDLEPLVKQDVMQALEDERDESW
ncbi:type II toxin-antitoxin system Phd/YefM family antitoxin [Gracilinema caldarium]|uniref:type II toxin-antitoxin system Phd/YefM family antitoxin n=1 Tax=Gracilinema caldarium TaxID=215591 RepID=UPI0026F30B4D|nr:type II toxin-antitoxin system Phd/YefM family antitoxin [Gracilinema caldarium]